MSAVQPNAKATKESKGTPKPTILSRMIPFLDQRIAFELFGVGKGAKEGIDTKKLKADLEEATLKKDKERMASILFKLGDYKPALSLLSSLNTGGNISSESGVSHNPTSVLWGNCILSLLTKDYRLCYTNLLQLHSVLSSSSSTSAVNGVAANNSASFLLLAQSHWLVLSALLIPRLDAMQLKAFLALYRGWACVISTTVPFMFRYMAYLELVSEKAASAATSSALYTFSSAGNAASANPAAIPENALPLLLESDSYLYNDALTTLLTTSLSLDFSLAKQCIGELDDLFSNDAILKGCDLNRIKKCARDYVLRIFLITHPLVPVSRVETLLHLESTEAKTWIDSFVAANKGIASLSTNDSGTIYLERIKNIVGRHMGIKARIEALEMRCSVISQN